MWGHGNKQVEVTEKHPLKEGIRLAESVTSFKSLLKTHFYRAAFE